MAYDRLFQAKVIPTLQEIFDTQLGPIFSGRVYYLVAPPLPKFPLLVYQSTDNGGVNDDKIGSNGWNGFITFRCLDYDNVDIWIKAQAVLTALSTITHADYDIRIDAERPQAFPLENDTIGNIYTAGIICSVYISPK